MRDLNALYRRQTALHQRDSVSTGFRWVIGDDSANSVFAFLRFGDEDGGMVLVVCNMTPVPRVGYAIGVPRPGYWRELLNTDAAVYGGSNMGNAGGIDSVRDFNAWRSTDAVSHIAATCDGFPFAQPLIRHFIRQAMLTSPTGEGASVLRRYSWSGGTDRG